MQLGVAKGTEGESGTRQACDAPAVGREQACDAVGGVIVYGAASEWGPSTWCAA